MKEKYCLVCFGRGTLVKQEYDGKFVSSYPTTCFWCGGTGKPIDQPKYDFKGRR